MASCKRELVTWDVQFIEGSKAGSVGRNIKRKQEKGREERLTVWEMGSEVEGA